MIKRRSSLNTALVEIEQGMLGDVSKIVVNRKWWDSLSGAEQTGYRRRCTERGVELLADRRLSAHFVEVSGGSEEPPLSSEHHV